MSNQQAIEKNYFDQISPGNYIDVRYSEQGWRIAKVLEKDRRYVYVSYDGINAKQEQLFINSFKVAPLRSYTEGYTGSNYRAHRSSKLPLTEYKNHLQMLNFKYLKQNGANAFEITEYLRGQLFVHVHSLLCGQKAYKQAQSQEVMAFLTGFMKFVIQVCKKVKAAAQQYFQAPANNKLLYLVNQKIALVCSLGELLILLNYMLKVDQSDLIFLFKNNKTENFQQNLIKIFESQKQNINSITELFFLSDPNGKWLPFLARKCIFKLIKKYQPKLSLPQYRMKDFQQVFQIYPFMIQEGDSQKYEEEYINFIISSLKEQSPFEAKLKSIQELKRIIQKDLKLPSIENQKIFEIILSKDVIDHLLNEYNFNPEIFKRFVPILGYLSKQKSLPSKSITSLFKIAQNRHESELTLIYQIICSLAEFISTDILDQIYGDILKININNDQVIKFIKNFTISAITNYSKQKSFFSSLFKKPKVSSKYGYYGLNLFYKETQDSGQISKEYVPICFQMIKDIFTNEHFHPERANYIGFCISSLQKKKNFGQSVKVMHLIISTYPSHTYIGDNKKTIVQKLDLKSQLVQLMVNNIKSIKTMTFDKISLPESMKNFYEFLQNYSDFFKHPIKVEHIQFLWTQQQTKLLCDFLKITREDSSIVSGRKKFNKRLDEALMRQILLKVVMKKSFYERKLTYEEFQAIQEIFLSYHYKIKNIDISDRGYTRYINSKLEGDIFYFQFMNKMADTPYFQRIVRKTIETFLRSKQQRMVEDRIQVWRLTLLKTVETLKDYPQKCLKGINIFFQMIKGRLYKQNVSAQGNVEVLVSYDQNEKNIILSKNSTIFQLRKMIMKSFNIQNDFTLYNAELKRDVHFVQEEDFSVNAMPLNTKGPTILITNVRKDKHPHFIAIDKFKKLIQKEQNFYQTIFSLIDKQEIKDLFWKTVEILPVNSVMVKKIEYCDNYTQKQWKQLMKNNSNQGLQYCLNIIYNLLQKNNEWAIKMYQSEGLYVIQQCLIQKVQSKGSSDSIIIKLIQIIIRLLDIIDKKALDPKILLQQNNVLLKSISQNCEEEKMNISIELLNNKLNLIMKNCKICKDIECESLDIESLLKIIQFAIFSQKDRQAIIFTEEVSFNYICMFHSQFDKKIIIFNQLIAELNYNYLSQKENSELYFVFLIDFMNTFIEDELERIYSDGTVYKIIEKFVYDVLKSNEVDISKTKNNQILFGFFKIILYSLKNKYRSFNIRELFQLIIHQFLFKKEVRRVKNEKNLKLLYELIKKMLFLPQIEVVDILLEAIIPQLRKNKWRKNSIQSWTIEPQRHEKYLFCGLQNLGATCYINCLFQQLFMIAEFRDKFIKINSQTYKTPLQQNQIYQLQTIFTALKYSNKKSWNTKKFCQSFITYEGVPINPVIQSDADQFFNTLMQKIETFLRAQNKHSIIQNTFEGKLSNQLNCEGCPHNSEKIDHFLSIGLNIRNKKSLEEALEGFVEGEILDGDNAYFCQICQKKVRTNKRLCIKQLPNILVVVLKRFQFNYDEMKKIKINTYLSYPQELNMKKYTVQHLQNKQTKPSEYYDYSLRGTVIHSGTSEGGHYYSFIKNLGKWYQFNDQYVEESNFKKIEEEGFGGEDKDSDGQFKFERYKNAYILFYQKKQKIQRSSAMQEQEDMSFEDEIKSQIINDNLNADFLSVMLDPAFIRLCENISLLQSQETKKFMFLYFNTVILRDKNREEYIPSYLRILFYLLKQKSMSTWYLSQINHRFFKEFCIQAPRIIRFISVSLIKAALNCVQAIPSSFVNHALLCLSKKGMTPFGKIFSQIAKKQPNVLIQNEYPKRVLNALFDTNYETSSIVCQSFDSYFGCDASDKQKDRQFCPSSLVESLKYFDIPPPDSLNILEKFTSREGNKGIAHALAKATSKEALPDYLNTLASRIITLDHKADEIEKYMFYLRELCCIIDENTDFRITAVVNSLKKSIESAQNFYDPIEIFIKETVKIAKRSKLFEVAWKAMIETSPDFQKILKCWLKQCQKPFFMNKTDEWKRKTNNMSYSEKAAYQSKIKEVQEERMGWMLDQKEVEFADIPSDIDDESYSGEITIRNKKFKIKEHLGLLKRIQYEKSQKWAILQKNELDIYYSL